MKNFFLCIGLLLLSVSNITSAQEATEDNKGMTGSALIGAVNINGKNYQQIGFRADIPLGKFGFGVDFQLLINDEGELREEDWDDFQDYLDKIYYVRYGYKNDPFYVRLGGLENSNLGYGIALDGYSNMIEYPTYKRMGGEISFRTSMDFGGEIFVNNFKELMEDEPGMLFGARGTYNYGKLSFGLGLVTDLNEYNGLRDTDDDDLPDEIDADPDDDGISTDRDYWEAKGASEKTLNAMIEDKLIDGRTKDEILEDLDLDETESIAIYTIDLGYNLYQTEDMTIDVYGQAAQINDYGFGFAAPAFRMLVGPFNFRAEYRHSEDEFLFGYFNRTYELERAWFTTDEDSNLVIMTKKSRLETVKAMDGFFIGVDADAFGVANLKLDYQYMQNDDDELSSIYGEFGLAKDLIPKLAVAKAYYSQDNVEEIKLKTPQTVMGFQLGYEITAGAVMTFDYRFTYEEVPGDAPGEMELEEIKTVQVGTIINF